MKIGMGLLALTMVVVFFNIAMANKFKVGDIAYVCEGTIFGEREMCKTEVLDTDGEKIQVLYLTDCTSSYKKGDKSWALSGQAGTVSEVRHGLECSW